MVVAVSLMKTRLTVQTANDVEVSLSLYAYFEKSTESKTRDVHLLPQDSSAALFETHEVGQDSCSVFVRMSSPLQCRLLTQALCVLRERRNRNLELEVTCLDVQHQMDQFQ